MNETKNITPSKLLTISDNNAGQRIDNFLFTYLKKIPKSRIYKMLRKGEVRVNKKRIDQLYRLKLNDQVRIPPFWGVPVEVKGRPSDSSINLLQSRILYEDANLLILNKPTGIAAHGGSGINFGVIEILRYSNPNLKNLELAHRLDRETSGCIILAKKRSILCQLHELMRTGKVTKRYYLLVRGQWQPGEYRVSLPLLKNVLRSGERIVRVDKEGKESITIFRPQRVFADATLVEAELQTGRTHQIRVHAAHSGHPIAGDEKYGSKEFNAHMRSLGLKRLFLHSYEISFMLADGKKINVTAVLDDDLQTLLGQLERV
jgi:23S rRNA pseudouridine955/2504/2580 synthase